MEVWRECWGDLMGISFDGMAFVSSSSSPVPSNCQLHLVFFHFFQLLPLLMLSPFPFSFAVVVGVSAEDDGREGINAEV